MLKSNSIDDYFEAKLSDLRPESEVPVDLHLYFSRNRHILVWKGAGERVTEESLARYEARGMGRVWIHQEDRPAWEEYLASLLSSTTSPAVPMMAAEPAPIRLPESEELRTEEGKAITEVMREPGLDDRARSALVATAARSILNEIAQAPSAPDETFKFAAEPKGDPNAHARDAVRDVLDIALASAAPLAKSIANEIWEISAIEPEIEHALDVATYSVLFAMSFGRIDRALLADIAVAGMLHDVGLSQIPSQVASMPESKQLYVHRQIYQKHVSASVALINEYAPQIPSRVKAIIMQHHEKFDGTGYPSRVQGFQLDDVAQLVVMADTLTSMMSGRWDGTRRTLHEAMFKLESNEKTRTFPQYFNPDVFAAVLRWMRESKTNGAARNAAEVVRAKARQLLARAQASQPNETRPTSNL